MQPVVEVSEKEFAIIQEIHNNNMPDQRMIAHKTGISLGMTNMIIQRLIERGFVSARQLNRKKIQYLLTPAGFNEKARKSYSYTLRTINNLISIRNSIQEVIEEGIVNGFTSFCFSGNGDIIDLAQIAVSRIKGDGFKFVFNRDGHLSEMQTVKLTLSSNTKTKEIDLMSRITNKAVE